MKIKKFWIPALILGVIGGLTKILDTFFTVTGKSFFINSEICGFIFLASMGILLITGYAFCISDRKYSLKISIEKNITAAFFGFTAAVAIIASGIATLISVGSSSSVLVDTLKSIFSILGGGVLIYESCISFTGHNGITRRPLLGIVLHLWGMLRLISLFIEYSRVSIHATEMFDVLSVSFLVLFIFYQSMLLGGLKTDVAFRRSTLYGICFVVCCLITTADIILKMAFPAEASADAGSIDKFVATPTVSRVLTCIIDIALCGYAASFIKGNIRAAKESLGDDDDYDEEGNYIGEDAPEVKLRGTKPSVNRISLLKTDDDELPEPEPFSGSVLRFEDTGRIDISGIRKAIEEKEEEEFTLNRLSVDDEPEAEEPEAAKPEPEVEEPKAAEPEPVAEEPKAAEPEPVAEEPKVAEPEPVAEEPEPVVTEPEAEVAAAEVTAAEPTEQAAEIPEPVPAKTEDVLFDDSEDDIFGPDKSDEDYDEIFRLLDEMSSDE